MQPKFLALAVSFILLVPGCGEEGALPKLVAATTAAVPDVTRGVLSVDGIEIPYFIRRHGYARASPITLGPLAARFLKSCGSVHLQDMRANVPYNKGYDLEKVTWDTLLDDIELGRAAVGIDKICVFGRGAPVLLRLRLCKGERSAACHARYHEWHATVLERQAVKLTEGFGRPTRGGAKSRS